jgi:tRNA nucleotidyltransferase (CCA-adding enzyme)
VNIKIYEVGGAVRDKLLGLKPKDIDYAVEAPSWEAMRQFILERGGQIFLETPQYFTIRAKVPDIGAADFVLCRRDGKYIDGRHPESVEVGTIFDDLRRRDFTINAMARDIVTNELFDPHGGRLDLRDNVLRFVGDADERLKEDRLRAFRAVRFAVTKEFSMHIDTKRALSKLYSSDFINVSTERIREELVKTFQKDSVIAFDLIFGQYPMLGMTVLERGIWFKPTMANEGIMQPGRLKN